MLFTEDDNDLNDNRNYATNSDATLPLRNSPVTPAEIERSVNEQENGKSKDIDKLSINIGNGSNAYFVPFKLLDAGVFQSKRHCASLDKCY